MADRVLRAIGKALLVVVGIIVLIVLWIIGDATHAGNQYRNNKGRLVTRKRD